MAEGKSTKTTLTVVEEEPQEAAITIRPVVTKDLFTVVKIILPQLDVPHIREMFSNMRDMTPEERDAYQSVFGMEIITMVLGVATDDKVQEWLADMAGMTKETFLDSPIDTTFKILQAMWADEDIRKIFTTLLQ